MSQASTPPSSSPPTGRGVLPPSPEMTRRPSDARWRSRAWMSMQRVALGLGTAESSSSPPSSASPSLATSGWQRPGSPSSTSAPNRADNNELMRSLQLMATPDGSQELGSRTRRMPKRKLMAVGAFALFVGFALFVVFTLLNRSAQTSGSSEPVCASDDCLQHEFRVARLLDDSLQPCDDFALYVCSAWRSEPVTTESVLQEASYAYSRRITSASWARDLHVIKASRALDMVRHCIDRSEEDQEASMRALRGFLREEVAETKDVLHMLVRLAVKWQMPVLFNIALLPNAGSRGHIIYIFPSGVLTMVLEFHKSLIKMGIYERLRSHNAPFLGMVFKNTPEKIIEVLLDALRKVRNATEMSFDDPLITLVKDLPPLNASHTYNAWLALFRNTFEVTPPITWSDLVVVTHPGLLYTLRDIYSRHGEAFLLESLQWLVTVYSGLLALTDAVKYFAETDEFRGAVHLSCVTEVEATSGFLLSRDVLENQTLSDVLNRFGEVKQLLISRINSSALLDMDTKLRAIDQLVSVKLSFSSDNDSVDALLHAYEEVAEINETPFFNMWLGAREYLDSWNGTFRYRLPHAIRRTLSSTLVYYDPPSHAVVLSPALLVPPFYYAGGTKAMVFGGLSFLLAKHLIRALVHTAHSWSANVSVPWLPLRHSDDELWRRRRQCLCSNDSSEHCFWFPSTPALDVLLDGLAASGDVAIKGMERFTPQQVAFITACHVTCQREWTLPFPRENAPAFSRECNAAMRNLPAFAEAFRCPPGSNMNPVKKCAFF